MEPPEATGAVDRPAERLARQRRCTRRQLLRGLSALALILGIGCIGWALGNIRAQSAVLAEVPSGTQPSSAERAFAVTSTPSAQTVTATQPSNARVAPRRLSKVIYAKSPHRGDILGSISIPVLGQTLPVIQGTRDSDLRKGVGHFTQSVMPGQKDNCVLSGHRDGVFSRLGEVKLGDRVLVRTASGTYTYEVKRTRIVGKDDRTVIVPTGHGVLTLTTCYPFHYVGNAPRRYIVSADLITGK